MSKLTRITVTIPTDLLEAAEEKLAKGQQNRSAFIRRVLEAALKEQEEKEQIEQFIQAYREQPQTEEEFGWQEIIAGEALEDLPWEEHK